MPTPEDVDDIMLHIRWATIRNSTTLKHLINAKLVANGAKVASAPLQRLIKAAHKLQHQFTYVPHGLAIPLDHLGRPMLEGILDLRSST